LVEFCGVKTDGIGWPAPHFAFNGCKKDEWWLRIVGLNGPADDVRNVEVLGSADAMTQVMVQGFINLQSALESTFLALAKYTLQGPAHAEADTNANPQEFHHHTV